MKDAVLADMLAITQRAVPRLPPKVFYPNKCVSQTIKNPLLFRLWGVVRAVETLEMRSGVIRRFLDDQPHRASAIRTVRFPIH